MLTTESKQYLLDLCDYTFSQIDLEINKAMADSVIVQDKDQVINLI
jgi:hypothetical protein